MNVISSPSKRYYKLTVSYLDWIDEDHLESCLAEHPLISTQYLLCLYAAYTVHVSNCAKLKGTVSITYTAKLGIG